ncbi:MAG: type IX secretion system protein PorQ [Bacteroidaceae bacterium]|nr:type IX secretion system protein PorQ [Bacteroidaceae bacterium]
MSPKTLLVFVFSLILFSAKVSAQESTSVFNFLNLPTSSHALALGGKNISLIEDDASLIFQNPALMSNVSDRSLNFNFLTYMQGSNAGNISYVQSQGERGTWGAMAQFVGYGTFPGYDENGTYEGNISGLDMNISGGYSYLLSDTWAGGVNGKFLYSNYAGYSSIALAVDLGLNYFNEDKDLSLSLAATNIGGQVTAFGDIAESLPIDIQLGISKGLSKLPLRLHATLFDMLQWKKQYYYTNGKDLKTLQLILNHINIGADLSLYDNRIWVGLGYNFRRGYEMKAAGSSPASGLTVGAGINIKRIKFGVAYGNYHSGTPTLSFTLAYAFAKKDKTINSNTQTIQ